MRNARWLLPILFLGFSTACSLFEKKSEVPRLEVRDKKSSSVPSSVDPGTGPRKRIALLPFLDANNQHPAEFKEQSRRALLIELNKSGEMIALEAEEMKADLSGREKNGAYDFKSISASAKDSGVAALLEGRIVDVRVEAKAGNIGLVRKLKTGIEVDVQVRVASLHGGKEIFNTVKTVRMEDEGVRVMERVDTDRFVQGNPELIQMMIKDAFFDFVPQIQSAMNRLSWEGRIAAIQGERIFLNVGRISGLQIGDLLKVSENGDDIFDPETGTFIGKSPGRLKGTLEIVSYFGNDGAIAVVHSGAGFNENDRVEIY